MAGRKLKALLNSGEQGATYTATISIAGDTVELPPEQRTCFSDDKHPFSATSFDFLACVVVRKCVSPSLQEAIQVVPSNVFADIVAGGEAAHVAFDCLLGCGYTVAFASFTGAIRSSATVLGSWEIRRASWTCTDQVTQFLGLNISYADDAIHLSTSKYAETLSAKFNIPPANLSTPYCNPATPHHPDTTPLNPSGHQLYQQQLGCLLLVGYVDADHAADPANRQSRTGFLFQLEPTGPISWNSQKQEMVALSSAEAEFIAATSAVREGLYLQELLQEAKIATSASFTLHCDNQSAIKIANKPGFVNRTKHIALRYFFVKDEVDKGKVILTSCPTGDMAADFLTKKLPRQ
ncbi:unnamed protein product, partial [Closterium sp. NIES-53]